MASDASYHLAGGIVASTAAAIARALASIPGASVEVSDDVEVRAGDYSLTVYPERPADEGGTDFLVGGNAWVPRERVRAIVREIAAALDQHDIVYELEVHHDGGPDETCRHARYRAMMDARAARTPPVASDAWTLDRGQIVVGDRLRAGTSDEVRVGWRAGSPDERVLITLTTKHRETYDQLRARLALAVEGIAPLEYVGPCESGPYADALVERLPAGQPPSPQLDELALARLGADVATVLARAHAVGRTVDGIRPELIFVDGGRLTGLVPRGPAFIAGAPIQRGVRTYHVPYLAPEQFLGNTALPASDVFALCTTLYFLGTGTHPFGDPDRVMELLGRMTAGQPAPWQGSPRLGDVLARGMGAQPAARPTATELADLLATLAR